MVQVTRNGLTIAALSMVALPAVAQLYSSRPARARATVLSLGTRVRHMLALLLLAAAYGTPAIAQGIEEGKPAPPALLRLLNGGQFSLAEQSGKVVIVNFWATWCAPCELEMPAFEAYYRKYRAQGLEIVAVSVDDPQDEARVRKTMQRYTFPGAMLRDAKIEGFGRVTRVPLTFVIDHRGIIRKDGRKGAPLMDLPTLEWTVTPYLPGAAERTGPRS